MTGKQLSLLGGHGILTLKDIEELTGAVKRVFDVLRDGQWHTVEELQAVGGREATRRARQLRQHGLNVEVKRFGESRDFRYRLAGRVSK